MSWMERASIWWWGARIPEPEVMDGGREVEAYAGAAAERYLARLDEETARRALELAPGARRAVDLGCGPGAVPLAFAKSLAGTLLVGVDLSLPMLRLAQRGARQRGLGGRVLFVRASASELPFRAGCFDLVMSNSLLHHLPRPGEVMREIARVGGERSAIFLRDLRRPPRLWIAVHLRLHGRHYRGTMRDLFEASVRAAYTRREVSGQVRGLAGVSVRSRGGAHLEAARAARS